MIIRAFTIAVILAAGLAASHPATANNLEFQVVEAEDRNGPQCFRRLFCVFAARQKTSIKVWAKVLTDTPLTFTMRTYNTKGVSGVIRKGPVVFDRSGVIRLAYLTAIGGGDASNYPYTYTYHPGRPDTANPDPNAVYELPFAPGRRHSVSQGQHNDNTHKKMEAYAVDWNFVVGEPVHAARGGVVAGAGGWSNSRKRGEGNFIWIRHADGTYAWYQHLRKDGVLVKRGQKVRTGQHIGFSGNTGKSSGPHLHFHVSVPTSGRYAFQTIPFRARTSKGIVDKFRSHERHRRPK